MASYELVVTARAARRTVALLVERRLVVGSDPRADLALPGLAASHLTLEALPAGQGVLVCFPDAPERSATLRNGDAITCGELTLTLGDSRSAPGVLSTLLHAPPPPGDSPRPRIVDTGRLHAAPGGVTYGDRLLRALHALTGIPSATSLLEVAARGLDVVVAFTLSTWGAIYLPSGSRGPATLIGSGLVAPPRLNPAAVASVLATGGVVRSDSTCEAYLPLRTGDRGVAGVMALGGGESPSEVDLDTALLLGRHVLLAIDHVSATRELQARQAELEGAHARLSAILDAIPDGVALVGRDGSLEGRRPRLGDSTEVDLPCAAVDPGEELLVCCEPFDPVPLQFDLHVVLGRDSSAHLVLPSAKVSRRHAEISRGPEGLRTRDLGSRNGTRVGGVPVGSTPVALSLEASLEIGPFLVRVVAARSGEETMVPSGGSRAADVTGSLLGDSLTDLLLDIERTQRSGVLEVVSWSCTGRITFRAGEPMAGGMDRRRRGRPRRHSAPPGPARGDVHVPRSPPPGRAFPHRLERDGAPAPPPGPLVMSRMRARDREASPS